MKAMEIRWDTDGENIDLPNEIEIPEHIVDEEEISDYLSDVTGFCHWGFALIENNSDKRSVYYDVVCSVYETNNNNGADCRVDSHLLCGGFETFDDALKYIDTHDCTKCDYVGQVNLYPHIEIERHYATGTLHSVIRVD